MRKTDTFKSDEERSSNRWFISVMIILVAICGVGIFSMATGWPTNTGTSDDSAVESVETEGENVVAESGDSGEATEDGAVVEAADGAEVSVEESGDTESGGEAESAKDAATEDSGETGGEQSSEDGSETEQTEQQ